MPSSEKGQVAVYDKFTGGGTLLVTLKQGNIFSDDLKVNHHWLLILKLMALQAPATVNSSICLLRSLKSLQFYTLLKLDNALVPPVNLVSLLSFFHAGSGPETPLIFAE